MMFLQRILLVTALLVCSGICAAANGYISARDYATLNDAVAAARSLGAKALFIPSGTYEVTTSINLSGMDDGSGAFQITGSGDSTVIVGKTPGYAVFDLIGSAQMEFSNFKIESQTSSIGILMCRSDKYPSDPGSAGCHKLYNVDITGNYSIAGIYMDCSEVNRLHDCVITNSNTSGYALITSCYTFAGVQSLYDTIMRSTNMDMLFENCTFGVTGSSAPGIVLIDAHGDSGTDVVRLVNCTFNASQTSVEAALILDGVTPPGGFDLQCVEVRGNYFNVPSARYGVLAKGSVTSVQLCNNRFRVGQNAGSSSGAAIKHNADVYGQDLRWWRIYQNSFLMLGGKYAVDIDAISRSRIEIFDVEAQPQSTYHIPYLRIGTSKGNTLGLDNRQVLSGGSAAGAAFVFDNSPIRTEMDIRQDQDQNSAVRREHFGFGGGDVILNLAAENVATISNPRAGDIAMDDGSNTPDSNAALAYYNGTEWVILH